MRSLLPIFSLCFLFSSAQETAEVQFEGKIWYFQMCCSLSSNGRLSRLWIAHETSEAERAMSCWSLTRLVNILQHGHKVGYFWSFLALSRLVPLLVTSQDCSLVIICKGFLADGTVFDSNEGKDPIRLECTTETKTNMYKDIRLQGRIWKKKR